MSTPAFVVLIGIILIWYEPTISSGQPLGMEEYYNLIEPKEDTINIWSKPRGKVNLKNLILSIKKLEAKQKQYWYKIDDGKTTGSDVEVTKIPTATTSTTKTTSTTSEVATHDEPPILTSLHEQIEKDQKRFYHSTLGGWAY